MIRDGITQFNNNMRRSGLRTVEVPIVQSMIASGKTAQEISDHLSVSISCIESFFEHPKEQKAAPLEELIKQRPPKRAHR